MLVRKDGPRRCGRNRRSSRVSAGPIPLIPELPDLILQVERGLQEA